MLERGVAGHLIDHWGKDSANRIGMFWTRWDRGLSTLAPNDAAELIDFLFRLPDEERAALAFRLAGAQ